MEEKKKNTDMEWDAEEKELWYSSMVADPNSHFDSERAYRLFLSRTYQQTVKANIFSLSRWFHHPMVAVAAVLFFLIASYASYWLGTNHMIQQFGNIIVEAPYGAKTELWLPDSTRVWLNAGSRLVYSQGFGLEERRIQLEGEAYFEVYKMVDMPFDVQTEELNVQVLGTKFNFRNYEDDAAASVNLMEGRVALDNLLSSKKETIYLNPMQKAVLDKRTGRLQVSLSRVHDAIEWTQDNLFFDELPLEDIVRELNRSYNVKIKVADESLGQTHFYASFNRREYTIEKVLDILTATHQICYTKERDEILLYKSRE